MLGGSRWGEEVLPGFSPSFGCGVLPAPVRVRAKKSSGPAAASADIAGAAAGVRSNTFYSTLHSRAKGIPQPAAGFSSVRSQDTGSASRADAAPRVFSAVCRPGSSHRSVIFLRVPKPLCPGPQGPVARDIASRFWDEQDPASSGEDRLGGCTTGSGASVGSGPRRRRRSARPAFRYQAYLFFPLLLLEAVRLRPRRDEHKSTILRGSRHNPLVAFGNTDRRVGARSAIGGSTTLCDQSFDAASVAASRLVAKAGGPRSRRRGNPPAGTQRSRCTSRRHVRIVG